MIREFNYIKKEKSKPVRHTHCFQCKEQINSQQYDECESCKGIVCSCGSCFCKWSGDIYDF